MAAPALRPLSIGEVLDTSFGLYRELFVPLLTIAIVCRVIPAMLGVYVSTSGGILLHPYAFVGQMLLTFATSAFGVAAVTFLVSSHYLGGDITARTALQQAIGRIVPLVILVVFNSLVISMGFILLIIPGIIFAAGLALGTVALVIERKSPTAAMERSWTLTRGFRVKVMVTIFVASLLLVIPLMFVLVIGGIGAATGVVSPVAIAVLTAVLQVFVFPLIYTVTTVLYYDLRVRKEGFDLDLLAAATQPA